MMKSRTTSKMLTTAENAKGLSAGERSTQLNCLSNSFLSRRVIEGSPLIEVSSPHFAVNLFKNWSAIL